MKQNKPIDAYPLHWPISKPRIKQPVRANFGDHSRSKAIHVLLDELRMLGATNVIISSNLKLRKDGLPYSSQRRPDDEGIAVYFDLNGSPKCFAVDKWNRTEHNIWAIAKTISALRGLERWGSKDMVEAAFRGFEALPAPEQTTHTWIKELSDFELRDALSREKEGNNRELFNNLLQELRSRRQEVADDKK